MIIHSMSLQGRRDYNEDRWDQIIGKKESLFAIYDGHGGDFVSSYLKDSFLDSFSRITENEEVNDIFFSMQKTLLNFEEAKECGSTVLIIRIRTNSKVQVISLGDSRAILKYGNKVINLNIEHKPNSKQELKRIESNGESVNFDKSDRIYRVNGYAVSRSLGDTNYPIISQKPFKTSLLIPKNSEYIILGSDGLWDVLSNEQICRFIDKCRKKIDTAYNQNESTENNIAYLLGEYAIKKGSYDNITILIIFLFGSL